jgi:hypothetical protein
VSETETKVRNSSSFFKLEEEEEEEEPDLKPDSKSHLFMCGTRSLPTKIPLIYFSELEVLHKNTQPAHSVIFHTCSFLQLNCYFHFIVGL